MESWHRVSASTLLLLPSGRTCCELLGVVCRFTQPRSSSAGSRRRTGPGRIPAASEQSSSVSFISQNFDATFQWMIYFGFSAEFNATSMEKKHKRNLSWGLQTWGIAFLFSLVSLPGLCFLHWVENKTKRFTHQVAKLDGGEPGLNEWPQAPKEVGRQGEPVFKDKRLSPSFTVLPWFSSVDTISHAVLTVAIPVDLHVHLLLHLHLVLVAQVVKLWVWLAQVALDEVELKGKKQITQVGKIQTQRYVVKISMTSRLQIVQNWSLPQAGRNSACAACESILVIDFLTQHSTSQIHELFKNLSPPLYRVTENLILLCFTLTENFFSTKETCTTITCLQWRWHAAVTVKLCEYFLLTCWAFEG